MKNTCQMFNSLKRKKLNFYSVSAQNSNKMNIKIIYWIILSFFQICRLENATLSEVNDKLKYSHEARIYREARLSRFGSELNEIIENLAKETESESLIFLGDGKIPLNVNETLKFLNEIKFMAKSLGSLNNFKPYKNISSCFGLKYKIEMMDFEIQTLVEIRRSLNVKKSILFFTKSFKLIDSKKFKKEFENVLMKLSQILKENSKYFEGLRDDIKLLTSFNETLIEFHKNLCSEHGEKNISTISYPSVINELVAIKDGKLLAKFKDFFNKIQQKNISFINQLNFFGNASDIFSDKHWKNQNQTISGCEDFFNRFKFLSLKEFQYSEMFVNVEILYQHLTFRESSQTEEIEITANFYSLMAESRRKILRAALFFYHFARAICDYPFKSEEKNEASSIYGDIPCGNFMFNIFLGGQFQHLIRLS